MDLDYHNNNVFVESAEKSEPAPVVITAPVYKNHDVYLKSQRLKRLKTKLLKMQNVCKRLETLIEKELKLGTPDKRKTKGKNK